MNLKATVSAIALCVAAPSLAFAQWGGLTPSKLLGPASPSPAQSPSHYVQIATSSFLDGAVLLFTAVNDSVGAAKAQELATNVSRPGGLTSENFGQVNEIADRMSAVAANKAALERAEAGKLRDAAVKVGIGSYFEALAIDATKRTVTGGFSGLAAIGSAGELAAVTAAAPGNLKAMLAVQSHLFGYLSAKGADPTATVQAEVAALERG